MKFLVFDTVGSSMQVALYQDGKIDKKIEKSFRMTSERLMPYIDELLEQNNLQLKMLDFVGVVVGPGSFTGIRIGTTTARAFSQWSGTPLVPITYTKVLAYNYIVKSGSSKKEKIVSISDASNGLAYVGIFDKNCVTTLSPQVITNDEIPSFLESVGNDYALCVDANMEKIVMPFAGDFYGCDSECRALCESIKAEYELFGTTPYNEVVPIYVRLSQAEADLRKKEL